MSGPAFGMGTAGIRDRVKKAIKDTVKMIKANINDTKQYCVGTITFDVFGFSRGAAAARHFVNVVTHGQYRSTILMQMMPAYGLLGEMLTDEGLMDDTLTKVDVRFVGIYDTVPHHGAFQDNDIADLGLDNVNRARYVVHMVAADEYRTNFSLVDISTVAKASPYDGDKGGIELIYPGVHCDVGGAYVDGGSSRCRQLDYSTTTEPLEKLKKEFVQQGWFKENELNIYYLNRLWDRLEGYKNNVSNQYSYIPLHFMANFCELRDVPIKEDKIINISKYTFTPNFIDKNVDFLEDMKRKLWEYTFRDGKAVTFENFREDIRFLRYHYLHWNSSYGDIREAFGTWISGKNKPNKDDDGKYKRHVR